ncbi:MAG: glycoside hydrolase TIM-barrel-like domain-containing protein, partial [Pseudomonadota bacterium]
GPVRSVGHFYGRTEYGAYAPGDGSNDVLFPLDPLWADTNIDFIGVDWYPPTGDWRDGQDHLDALAGFDGPDDPDYLLSQMAGGEAFDWFYASQADRDAQVRTPISDTAHSEHWVFRQKDLLGWWSANHHERPGGTRSTVPTLWQPGSKPIRLSEIGFPAVDKGGNSPNLFFDPKSSESAVPPYSTGERDDLLQLGALSAALQFWQDQSPVEATYVWAWDARPWPVFPLREDIWSDGTNWQFGHWLNGRVGLSELGRVIEDIARRGGVGLDASAVEGVLDGYVLSGVSSVRDALEPLFSAFDLNMIERDGRLVVEHAANASAHSLAREK